MKKLLFFIMPVFLVGCCFGNPDCVVSPERIAKNKIDKKLKQLRKTCNSKLANGKGHICDKEKLKFIGHGAGSFRHYAMDVTYEGGIEGNNRLFHIEKAEDVNVLMSEAFEQKQMNAIEIDVHVPTLENGGFDSNHPLCKEVGEKECAFVMHNKPKWDVLKTSKDSAAYAYLKKNTLTNILNYFLANNYEDEIIYLEFKAEKECMLPKKDNKLHVEKRCDVVPIIVSDIVNKTIKQHDVNSRLTVASFSASALTTIKSKLGKQVKYGFIAGYDKKGPLGIKAYFAQCKGPVPHFSGDMKDFASTTEWLDHIWFSVKAITEPNKVFSNISKIRSQHFKQKPELNYSVSSYDIKEETFIDTMSKFTLPLYSIMVDIDD